MEHGHWLRLALLVLLAGCGSAALDDVARLDAALAEDGHGGTDGEGGDTPWPPVGDGALATDAALAEDARGDAAAGGADARTDAATGLPPEALPEDALFVAPSGDDAAAGTLAAPFRTIPRGLRAMGPGATLVLRGGRYPAFEVRNLHGRADAPITIRAYPGERVVIDSYLPGSIPRHTVYLSGTNSYVVFEGFEVTSSDPLIDELRRLDITRGADLETFRRYVDHPTVRDRNAVEIQDYLDVARNSHHITFRDLHLHHLLGLGFSGNGRALVFERNHVHDLGHPRSGYAWYTYGPDYVLRDNVVHDVTRAMQLRGTRSCLCRMVLERNLIYNAGNRPFYHMSSGTVKSGGGAIVVIAESGATASNNIVRNNVFARSRYGIGVDAPGLTIAHNTFTDLSLHGVRVDASGVRVLNNIFWRASSRPLDTPTPPLVAAGNLIDVDPRFREASALDFRLEPGSPAVDGGVDAAAWVTDDFDGLPRPVGGWDQGAFEQR